MRRFRAWGVWLVFLWSIPSMAAPETIVPASVGKGLSCGESTLAVGSAEVGVLGEALGEQRTLITLVNFADNPVTPYAPSQVGSAGMRSMVAWVSTSPPCGPNACDRCRRRRHFPASP